MRQGSPADAVGATLSAAGESVMAIGHLETRGGGPQVIYRGLETQWRS